MSIVLLWIVAVLPCWGQDSSLYYIRHFDSENGLPQSTIKAMQLDSKGFLWILTEAGLVRYDGYRFVLYDQLPEGGKLSVRVSSLHLCNKDTIAVVDVNGRVYRAGSLGRLEVYTMNQHIQEVAPLVSGSLALNVHNKCYGMVLARELPVWAMPEFRVNDLPYGKGLGRIDGYYYWFNTRNELICADTALQQFKRIDLHQFPHLTDPAQQVKIVPHVNKLVVQWGKYLCIGQISGVGVLQTEQIIYTGHTGAITNYLQLPKQPTFFVGTLTNGFYQYTQKGFTTKTFQGNSPNDFYALAPFDRNDVLTSNGIVTGQRIAQLEGYRAFSVLKTRMGRYVMSKWTQQGHNGLAFFDSTLHQVDFLPLPRPAIGYMYELNDRSICVTALGKYFGRLRAREIDWFPDVDSLKGFQVSIMHEAGNGLLWIAGPQGLARFDVNTRRFERVKGLEGMGARSMHVDSLGVVWIGTYGNGYFAYWNDKIIRMPLDREEYLRHVHALLVDRNGYCWMSTNRGLFQARLQGMQNYVLGRASTVYYHYYDKNSGFLTNEFNGGGNPSAVETPGGLFSFPSMNGVVQFDPLSVKPVFSDAGIYVDHISADTMDFTATTGQLRLQEGVQFVSFYVSSPFWGTTGNHHIEYRLNKVDSLWRPLPADGKISFERLPGGSYEIVFRKHYGFDGQEVQARQAFTIPLVFYERWWFRLSLAIISLFIVWLIFRLRFKYLTRLRQRLEKEVVFRTQEQDRLIKKLQSTVTELEASEGALAHHARMLEMVSLTISHDLQSPLRFFSDLSATLYQKSITVEDPGLRTLVGNL